MNNYQPSNSTDELKQLLLCLFLILAVSAWPLLQSGLLCGLDSQFHYFRLLGLSDALQAGASYPMLLYPSYFDGFAYAAGGMYCDIFILPFALLKLCGISGIICYKLYTLSIILFTCLTSYYAGRGITKSHSAALFLMFSYCLSINFFANLYHRCALGEFTATVFVPLLIWGLYNLTEEKFSKAYLLIIAFTGLLLCHALASILAVIVSLIWIAARINKLSKDYSWITKGILALFIFLSLSSFYWLRFLEQYFSNDFHFQNPILVTSHFTFSLFSTSAGTTAFAFGLVGLILTICVPVISIYWLSQSKHQKTAYKALVFSLISLTITLICFWRDFWILFDIYIPINLQGPFRLNIFNHFLLFLSGAFIISKLNIQKKYFITILLIIGLSHVAFLRFVVLKDYTVRAQPIPSDQSIYFAIQSGFGNEWLPHNVSTKELSRIPRDICIDNSGNPHSLISKETGELYFDHKQGCDAYQAPRIWYKGYAAELKDANGVIYPLEVTSSEKGLVYILSPPTLPDGNIHVYYASTNLQLLGNSISAATLLLLLAYFIRRRCKSKATSRSK